MTLCISWIRKTSDSEELIFATDSCLSGGERWNSGVKLFQLPRTDCLISFSGFTGRTYPLILNLINSLKYDKYVLNQNHDITQLLEYVTELFTEIIKTVTPRHGTTLEEDLRESPFDFLFGGWSWRQNSLKLWRIFYSFDSEGFVFEENYERIVFSMIGDKLDEARNKLQDEMIKNNRIMAGFLDMEPLKVLVEIIRDSGIDIISGPVQFAKIYPPGVTEVFGVYYPSAMNGTKTFLGRDVSNTNNPSVRFLDPDTGTVSGQDVPPSIVSVDTSAFGSSEEFVLSCYEGSVIKENLSEKEIELLQSHFKDYAYRQYLKNLKENLELEESFADV